MTRSSPGDNAAQRSSASCSARLAASTAFSSTEAPGNVDSASRAAARTRSGDVTPSQAIRPVSHTISSARRRSSLRSCGSVDVAVPLYTRYRTPSDRSTMLEERAPSSRRGNVTRTPRR
jgi:hypothetical protein